MIKLLQIFFLVALLLMNTTVKSDDRIELQTAFIAGGCYWGLEDLLRKLDGVKETTVGFSGGHLVNASYKDVSKGDTGHAESIKIIFDGDVINFQELLFNFFRMHNPTTINQQGNDVGTQYRSAIFFTNQYQKDVAIETIDIVNKSNQWEDSVVTEVVEFTNFYPAEESHQDYILKNPNGYSCHFDRKFDFTR